MGMRLHHLAVALLLVTWPALAPAQVRAPQWVDDDAKAEQAEKERAAALGVEDDTPPPPPDEGQLGDEEPDDPYPDKIDPSVFVADPEDRPPPPPPPPTTPGAAKPGPGTPAASPGGATVKPGPRPGSRPDNAAPPPLTDEDLGARAFGTVERAGDLRAHLLELWHQRRLALAASDTLAAANRLNAIIALFRRYGGEGPLGSSARDVGAALAREASTALTSKDSQRAVALADSATLLAPDVAPVWMTQARVRMAHAPTDLQGIAMSLRGAALALGQDLATLIGLIGSALILVFVVVLAAPLVAALLFLLRSARLLAHDLRHLLPRGVSGLQALLLAALLAALPVLFKLGPLLAVLWWLVLIWAYLSRRERVAVLGLWLLTLLAPAALVALGHLNSAEARRASEVYALSRDLLARDAKERLTAMLREQPADPLVLATLGVLHKRDGELGEARARLEQAIASKPGWAWLHNNLGNVRVLDGDVDGALAAYRRAVDLQPDLLEAHFNTTNLYHRQRKMVQAKEASAAALALDPVRFNAFKEMADTAPSRVHNRAVVDVNLPLALVARTLLETPPDQGRLHAQVGRLLFFGLGPTEIAGVTVVGFALLLLLGMLLARLKTAHACPRCGQPACNRCDADLPRHDVCAQCYHAFLAPGAHIDQNLKIKKEIEVRRYRARRNSVRRLLSALLAGSGHLVAGAPLRGAVALLLLATVVAGLLSLGGLIPSPFVVSAGWPVGRAVLLGLLFLLLVLWAVISAARLED